MNKYIFKLLIVFLLNGCFMEAGTHGSLKCWQYNTKKDILESAVMEVITQNPNIERDSIRDYYNDGENYLTVNIKSNDQKDNFIIRFGGDSLYWDTSAVSSVFICYAHDKFGQGGSEGNGEVNSEILSSLLTHLESELISKLDRQLGLTHKVIE